MPNHRLPIVAETVNHANLSDARNSWVRLLDCQDGRGRIFTATPRFEGNKLIIDGKDVDNRDHEAKTHGWIKDPEKGTHARRVHKLPIFCWSIVEGLEDMLTPKNPA
jgi:hypothetical protein